MEDVNETKLLCLDMSESILMTLIYESQRNDSKRFLAGLRRPSKLQRRLLDDLSDIHKKRRNITGDNNGTI